MRNAIIAIAALAGGCLHEDADYKLHCTYVGYKATPKTDEVCEMLTYARYGGSGPALAPALDSAAELYLASADKALPWAYDHALDVDPVAVDQAMVADGIDPVVAKVFSTQLRAWRKEVFAKVDAQPQAWRDVFIKPIVATRAAWQKAEARRAPWLAKLEPLVERHDEVAVSGKKDARLVGELLALQRAYLADCAKAGDTMEACLGDDVARPLTRKIVHLAVLADDGGLIGGQGVLFQVPDRSKLEYAVRLAAKLSADAMAAEYRDWHQATQDGASEASIRKRWPTPPIAIDSQLRLGGDEPSSDDDWKGVERSQVHDGIQVRIQIARVERRGDEAVLYARKNIETGEEGTGCYETNKASSIAEDGTINYRTECAGSVTVSHDETPKPITVPWIEAAQIRPMDVVLAALGEKRRGHVETVRAGDKAVPTGEISSYSTPTTPTLQLGSFRLDGAAKPEAKAQKTPSPKKTGAK